jgi:hypothetical protein
MLGIDGVENAQEDFFGGFLLVCVVVMLKLGND